MVFKDEGREGNPPGCMGEILMCSLQHARPASWTVHELKTLPEFYQAIVDEEKTFEIRKNDRGFKVGDYLRLKEIYSTNGKRRYTGREVTVIVRYIFDGSNLSGIITPGFVIMSIDICRDVPALTQ